MDMGFFEYIEERADKMDTFLCIGLDPAFSNSEIEKRGSLECAACALEQNLRIIEGTASYALAFKPNIAFYEAMGNAGMSALYKTLAQIPEEIPIIIDAKRGDIANTAEAYARAIFGELKADAVTLNPYLGLDTLEPFLRWSDRGIFVLCRTSNPGAGFLQDITVNKSPLYSMVAQKCSDLSVDVGLVVAGNDLEALQKVRKVAPSAWFLSPGIGAQGGRADLAFAAGARSDGKGILVAAARSISEAQRPDDAALELRDVLRRARDAFLFKAAVKTAKPSKKAEDEVVSLKREFVDVLLSTECFRLGEFVLKSGKKSPFYIDLRNLISDPEAMRIAGRAYAHLASSCDFDIIGGIPSAGLPLATVASLELGKPMIWPRMPAKDHGTGKRIEGRYAKGDRVLLLDDLITTGASKIEAKDILKSEGLEVRDLVVLIERGSEGRVDMEREGVRLHAFMHVNELFEALKENGRISEAQYSDLVDFGKTI